MNTKLLLAVADAIERHPERYDQEVYVQMHKCGTKACIAGHAVALKRRWGLARLWRADAGPDPDEGLELGAKALDLTTRQANWLFHPCWEPREGRTVPEELRLLARDPSAWPEAAP